MSWPPVKAWTSKFYIQGQIHFVAINYGGNSSDRWVVLMSVIDSNIVLEISWEKLVDPSYWESGWNENIHLDSSELVNNKCVIRTPKCINPSSDSGLTIPITKKNIRPWYSNV